MFDDIDFEVKPSKIVKKKTTTKRKQANEDFGDKRIQRINFKKYVRELKEVESMDDDYDE